MKHKKFKVTSYPLLSWEEALNTLNDRFHDKTLAIASTSSGQGDFNLHETLIIDLDPTPRNIELINALQIKERAERICNHPFHMSCSLYLSFTAQAKSHGKHMDIADVFHWQQQGRTDFSVWENDVKYTYNLIPGDVIFIPAGIYHDAFPRSPRFGLSFGLLPTGYGGGDTKDKTQEEIIAEFTDRKDYSDVI
jgi:hypothetical protein